MDFFFTGSGTVIMGGCATVSRTECELFRYEIGSVVYICEKASQKGKLEAICIKSVRVLLGKPSPWGCFPPPEPKNVLYTDTYNTIWEQDELCTHREALDLAIEYWEELAEEAAKLDC
jgi:hypothetical protein